MVLVYSENPTKGLNFQIDEFFDSYRVIGRTAKDKIVDFIVYYKFDSKYQVVDGRSVIIKENLISMVLK